MQQAGQKLSHTFINIADYLHPNVAREKLVTLRFGLPALTDDGISLLVQLIFFIAAFFIPTHRHRILQATIACRQFSTIRENDAKMATPSKDFYYKEDEVAPKKEPAPRALIESMRESIKSREIAERATPSSAARPDVDSLTAEPAQNQETSLQLKIKTEKDSMVRKLLDESLCTIRTLQDSVYECEVREGVAQQQLQVARKNAGESMLSCAFLCFLASINQ